MLSGYNAIINKTCPGNGFYGPLCQGRMCGTALSEIISLRTGNDIKEVGSIKIKPSLKIFLYMKLPI